MVGTALEGHCDVPCSHLDRSGRKRFCLEPEDDITYEAQRSLLLLPGPHAPIIFPNSTACLDAKLRDKRCISSPLPSSRPEGSSLGIRF